MKVTLYKGIDNTLDFIIKKNKSTLPLVLTDADEFKVHLIELGTNINKATIAMLETAQGQVTITNKGNGKISVLFKESLVSSLKSAVGSSPDDFYAKVTHKLLIEANTANQGKFIIALNKVAVG